MVQLLVIELVKDRTTKEPATAEVKQVVERVRQRGLLVGKSGGSWSAIRLAPPLCITKADVEFVIDCLDACIAETAA